MRLDIVQSEAYGHIKRSINSWVKKLFIAFIVSYNLEELLLAKKSFSKQWTYNWGCWRSFGILHVGEGLIFTKYVLFQVDEIPQNRSIQQQERWPNFNFHRNFVGFQTRWFKLLAALLEKTAINSVRKFSEKNLTVGHGWIVFCFLKWGILIGERRISSFSGVVMFAWGGGPIGGIGW
jgi:hypothetical protein